MTKRRLSATHKRQGQRIGGRLARLSGPFGAIILFTLLGSVTASAQDTCIPRAIGVPFQNSAPNWFDPGQPANSPTRFNACIEGINLAQPPENCTAGDPRWRGAVNHTFGTGAAEQVSFKALHSNVLGAESLYLSWVIKVSPSLAIGVNQLFVGFSPGGGLDDVIINIALNNSAPGNATTNTTRAILTKPAASPGTAYTAAAEPAWLPLRTRIWVDNTLGVGMGKWAVQMVIPISGGGLVSGLNLSSPFKMWFEVDVAIDTMNFATYRFPRPPDVNDPLSPPQVHGVDGGGNDQYPETSTWGTFRLSNGDADNPDPACPFTGVSLKVGEIGTTNVPSYLMHLNSPNTFIATPTNNTGSSIADGKILASFFLANWGSVIGVDDPSDPAGPWKPIAGLQDIPSAGITANGAQANISMAKSFNAAERQPFIDGTKNLHQCILVKLRALVPLTFTNDSVARNMNFDTASKRSDRADISVVGLPDMPGSPTRDVYLYVEAANMPARIPGGGQPPTTTRPPIGAAAATQPGGQNQPGISGELDPVIPTFRVHGYNYSGKSFTRKGVTYRILNPQTSFGYYLTHNGPVTGWTHDIQGAQKIGPRLYLIAVPNKSASRITINIEAVEPGQPPTDKRFGLSVHAGGNFPHGTFGNLFDPGFSFTADLEYRLTNNFSLEGLYGYNRFRGQSLGPVQVGDLNLHNFSLNGKAYAGSGTTRPFFNFGFGAYKFDPGDTKAGTNIGTGLQFNVSPTFAVEGAYNFHSVFTSGSNTKFSTLQGGIRFRF